MYGLAIEELKDGFQKYLPQFLQLATVCVKIYSSENEKVRKKNPTNDESENEDTDGESKMDVEEEEEIDVEGVGSWQVCMYIRFPPNNVNNPSSSLYLALFCLQILHASITLFVGMLLYSP